MGVCSLWESCPNLRAARAEWGATGIYNRHRKLHDRDS